MKVLPVIIDIHVEPDNHYLSASENENWHGFEKGSQIILDYKASWPELKLSWLFRADPQIGHVYGENAWGLDYYKETINRLVASGDKIGIHMHPYRFNDEGEQVQDYSDLHYLKFCMDEAVEAFEKVMGYKPEILANTVGTTSTELVNHNRLIGIKYDLSLNKDSRKEFADHIGKYKGQRSSGTDFPGKIYCPSTEDYRTEHASPDEYRMIPIQCFNVPTHSLFIDWIIRTLKQIPNYKKGIKLTLSEQPKQFKKIINRTIGLDTPYLVIDSRSNIFNSDFKIECIIENLDFLRNHEKINLNTPGSWLKQIS